LVWDEEETYSSPLTANASVRWETREFKVDADNHKASIDFNVTHDLVEWDFLQKIYGWNVLQFETWARGFVHNLNDHSTRIALYPTNILELSVNGANIFGADFYGFERSPVIVDLVPGRNNLIVRLIRDVRANGGESPPSILASLRMERLKGHVSIVPTSVSLPDIFQGRFTSIYGSLALTNHGEQALTVESIRVTTGDDAEQVTSLNVAVVSGQTRPLVFELNELQSPDQNLSVVIDFRLEASQATHSICTSVQTKRRGDGEPVKITFRHSSGALSYAVLRPPNNSLRVSREQLPVLVALHGSGVDVDGDQSRTSFDAARSLDAWILFASGMSPWCGDDWHTWGAADIETGLKAIPDWIEVNQWQGPGADLDRILVAGHSNGGHGSWHLALHQPDTIIGVAAASGYSSIENYVPYSMWAEREPTLMAMFATARTAFREEMLLTNLKGVPALVQHGTEDDNVPIYHARLMKDRARRVGTEVQLVEIPGKGHWWNGAMTTQPLLDFYRYVLAASDDLPSQLDSFTFTVTDSHAFGSKGGFSIDQLFRPTLSGQLECSSCSTISKTKSVITRNVRRLRYDPRVGASGKMHTLILDGATFIIGAAMDPLCFLRASDIWTVEQHCNKSVGVEERLGRQRGALDAVMRTQGLFEIVHFDDTATSAAVQVSRNLHQYFGADSRISPGSNYSQALAGDGNVIVLALGDGAPRSLLEGFPINVVDNKVMVHDADKLLLSACLGTAAIGGAWLRPLHDEKLELIVWGSDVVRLGQAARMIPTLTGAGQPDFVLFGAHFGKGHDNIVAAGFFDHSWNISASSYFSGCS
jgi:predicted esterase